MHYIYTTRYPPKLIRKGKKMTMNENRKPPSYPHQHHQRQQHHITITNDYDNTVTHASNKNYPKKNTQLTRTKSVKETMAETAKSVKKKVGKQLN